MFLIPLILIAHSVMQAEGLQTQYLNNPLGIDEPHPKLTWYVTSTERADKQTAYQILVAPTKEDLAKEQNLLWNSGKNTAARPTAIYAGHPLTSGENCYWKVRVWDARGNPTNWSPTHQWSMGLLKRQDWRAEWITSPILADPINRPRTPIDCYRSELSNAQDATKWITLDLQNPQQIDRINLAPARPNGLNADLGTVQFPRRLRLEASDTPDFQNPKTLVDRTNQDIPEQRGNNCEFKFPPTKARYVRLVVTRLGVWDAHDYGIFLAQFAAYDKDRNISTNATVTASDSIENDQYGKHYLVQEHPNVQFAPFPPALDPKVDKAFSSSRTALLRQDFQLDVPIRRATLYATARGFYEATINGKKVGKDLLAPGFTDYHKRISYEAYDVTPMLCKGQNEISALLGYGWYAGHMNLAGNGYFYGYFPQFAAQLNIEFANGHYLTIPTNSTWQATLDAPVRWSDLLDGEACDFRIKPTNWQPAWSQPLGPEDLVAQKTPPVQQTLELKPIGQKEIRPGVWVYDVGQEITGWIRLKATGPAGTHIVIRHAEAITDKGELDTASLWGTLQQDDYILDGKGSTTVEPHFTYHGFRYFEVSGLSHPPAPADLTVVNIHSKVDEVGAFECSNPLFNRLMEASKWTQRNLFFDVPAGCAARSERLAWTGDIRPCVQTALFNFDTAAFFQKYAADLRDDQKPDGRFTDICPHAHLTGTDICVGSPGWADAGVSLPWDVYVNTGDLKILADHYQAAKRWVDFIHTQNPGLIWQKARGQDWGDWLSAGRATPKELGATAFFAHSTDLVARMAHALGNQKDAETYKTLFQEIKKAFTARYVTPEGEIKQNQEEEDAQGSYALALHFNLLEEPLKTKALTRLLKVIERDGGHPATGFWSTTELLLALSDLGQNDQAAKLANLDTYPSWGHMLKAGGTTFWEAFDADKKTLSLNHWTHSACGEWLWRNVAGLNPDPENPGYEHFIVRPRPTKEVTSCKATYRSPRGPIQIEWSKTQTQFTLTLKVPPGCTAQVTLPDHPTTVQHDGVANQVQRQQNQEATYKVTSGVYRFTAM